MWHLVARSVTFFCCREALRDMYGLFPPPRRSLRSPDPFALDPVRHLLRSTSHPSCVAQAIPSNWYVVAGRSVENPFPHHVHATRRGSTSHP